jgi:hypothetical protein
MAAPTHVGVFTSTTSSQTLAVPAGATSMKVVNAAANPLYLKFAATVAVPTTLASGEGEMYVAASSNDTFALPASITALGGTLAYIAVTAGGALTIILSA